jgi:3-dehydroquinate synthase
VTAILVPLRERSYEVRIRPGSLEDLASALRKDLDCERAIVITTPRVGALHYDTLARGCARQGVRVDQLRAPDGDRAKTLRHAARLYDGLIELGAERHTPLLGLGGGALCDLTGFVASSYLRGVPLVQVPTTLLAQVDASVGGKTGLNHPRGKNLIGSFYQPKLVWIDPDTLSTLPRRELRCGMAEIVKAAALWDLGFFCWLEEHVDRVMQLERAALGEAIARAVAIKAEIVGQDEREAGPRALLNFGHTLAHAIEAVAGYRRIRHGEAVAIGMVFAARVSEKAGMVGPEVAERLARLLSRIGLPTEAPDWREQRQAYLRAISVDKKVRDGSVGFVVLRELGRAEQVQLSPEDVLAGAA